VRSDEGIALDFLCFLGRHFTPAIRTFHSRIAAFRLDNEKASKCPRDIENQGPVDILSDNNSGRHRSHIFRSPNQQSQRFKLRAHHQEVLP
jgi:hypothetical protein